MIRKAASTLLLSCSTPQFKPPAVLVDEPWDSEHNKKLLPKMSKVDAPVRGPAPKEPHSTYYQVKAFCLSLHDFALSL